MNDNLRNRGLRIRIDFLSNGEKKAFDGKANAVPWDDAPGT